MSTEIEMKVRNEKSKGLIRYEKNIINEKIIL